MYRFNISVALVVITVLYSHGLAMAIPLTQVKILGPPECIGCGVSTGDPSSPLAASSTALIQVGVSDPGPPPSFSIVTIGGSTAEAIASADFGTLRAAAFTRTFVGDLPQNATFIPQPSYGISSNTSVSDSISLGSSEFAFGTISHTGFTLDLNGILEATGAVGAEADFKYTLVIDQIDVDQQKVTIFPAAGLVPIHGHVVVPYDLAVGDSHNFVLSFDVGAKSVADFSQRHVSESRAAFVNTLTLTIDPGPGFFITSASGATYAPPTAVPETSSLLLLGCGLLGLAAWRWKHAT